MFSHRGKLGPGLVYPSLPEARALPPRDFCRFVETPDGFRRSIGGNAQGMGTQHFSGVPGHRSSLDSFEMSGGEKGL